MNISMTAINKITALMGKVLYEHGTEIAEILQMLGVRPGATNPPPPVPVPLPVPPTSLPEGFDELFYLAMYPDVVKAVRTGYFLSGGDHYIKHGMQEGRAFKPSIVTSTVPPPLPPTNPAYWVPEETYMSQGALVGALRNHSFDTAVYVGGARVWDGFGPAIDYYELSNGFVTQHKPTEVTPPPAPPPAPPVDGEVINLNP